DRRVLIGAGAPDLAEGDELAPDLAAADAGAGVRDGDLGQPDGLGGRRGLARLRQRQGRPLRGGDGGDGGSDERQKCGATLGDHGSSSTGYGRSGVRDSSVYAPRPLPVLPTP